MAKSANNSGYKTPQARRGAEALKAYHARRRAEKAAAVEASEAVLPVPVDPGDQTVNPLTSRWRKSLLKVYDAIGGDRAFAKWAKQNQTTFYRLIKDSAPREREANAVGSGVNIQINTYGGGEPATVQVKGGRSDPE